MVHTDTVRDGAALCEDLGCRWELQRFSNIWGFLPVVNTDYRIKAITHSRPLRGDRSYQWLETFPTSPVGFGNRPGVP